VYPRLTETPPLCFPQGNAQGRPGKKIPAQGRDLSRFLAEPEEEAVLFGVSSGRFVNLANVTFGLDDF
jgi:hypothetical protein